MAQAEFTDAIALLKSDHREVDDLFEKFENARGSSSRQKICQQICVKLKIHTMIEEEIFYPALRGKIDDNDIDEAYVEHDGAKVLINDLTGASPDAEFYDAKMSVLAEEIRHHVKEEERPRDGMFAQARATDVDLVALRDLMVARKNELMAQAKGPGLPIARPTAVNLVTA